jgi:membrane protein implicated in regulation of membrane protease activity
MFHLVTGLILLVAFIAQGSGMATASGPLFAIGVTLEVWFWRRTFKRRGQREDEAQ